MLHHTFSRRIKKLFLVNYFVVLILYSSSKVTFQSTEGKRIVKLKKLHLSSIQSKLLYFQISSCFATSHNEEKVGLLWCEKSNITLLWKNISQSLMWKRINTSNKGPVDHRTKQQYWTVFLRSGKTVFKQEIVWTGKQKLFNSWRSKIKD